MNGMQGTVAVRIQDSLRVSPVTLTDAAQAMGYPDVKTAMAETSRSSVIETQIELAVMWNTAARKIAKASAKNL